MKYNIPLFDLNFDDNEERAVIDVLHSKWISTGPMCQQFENRFKEMLGVKYALSMANCTVALHIAMKLCEIGEGDEVICPSLTFVATVNAIRYVGGVPVFAEVTSHNDFTIDPSDVRSKITPKSKAIVVMHYGGFACDMSEIMRIAIEHNLKVIEDSSHAPLSEYAGEKLGTIGDIGCFSFFSNKNISTAEGGMIVTNDEKIYQRGKLLRSHGMTSMSYERATGHSTEYDVVELGYNYRMDDIRAAIAIEQLKKLYQDLSQRAVVRQWYIEELEICPRLIIPFKEYYQFTSNYIFPILLRNGTKNIRDGIRNELALRGIQTSVHYPAVHRFSIYRRYYSELPLTDYVSDNMITLPMFASLSREKVSFICDSLRSILIAR